MKSPLSVTTMHLEINELNYSSTLENITGSKAKMLKGKKNRLINRNKLLFQSQTGQKLRKEILREINHDKLQPQISDVNTVHGSVHNVNQTQMMNPSGSKSKNVSFSILTF